MPQGPETHPSASGRNPQDQGKEIEKAGNFPTELPSGPKNIDTPPSQQAREIAVYSEFDPSSKMLCCGKPTIQKQIDYTITVNHELLRIPKIWANVCQTCNQPFFAPAVGTAISDEIFQLQHPRETKIAKLLAE